MTKNTKKECRNCAEIISEEEAEYGWGDTCFICIKESASEEEIHAGGFH